MAGAPPITGRRHGQAPQPHTSPLNISMCQVGLPCPSLCLSFSSSSIYLPFLSRRPSPYLSLLLFPAHLSSCVLLVMLPSSCPHPQLANLQPYICKFTCSCWSSLLLRCSSLPSLTFLSPSSPLSLPLPRSTVPNLPPSLHLLHPRPLFLRHVSALHLLSLSSASGEPNIYRKPPIYKRHGTVA